MEEELLRKIDAAYRRLEEKRAQVVCALKAAGLETASGWYNGLYIGMRKRNGRKKLIPSRW